MSQIKTKFIENNAVTTAKVANNAIDSSKLASNAVDASKIAADSVNGSKIRLDNDQALRARNAANSADVNILKANSSDVLELLTDVELSDRKLLNALVNFSTQATDPGSAVAGDVYYNTVSNKLRQYNGTIWEDVSAASGANTALSNLASTQINTELYFDSAASALIGSEDGTSSNSMSVRSGVASAGSSGAVDIQSGTATGAASGNILITSGVSDTTGTGSLQLLTGTPSAADVGSGNIELKSGVVTGNANSGTIQIWTGDTVNQPSGQISIATGNTLGSATTGDLQVITGTAAGTGSSGNLDLATGGSAVSTGGNTGNITIHTSDTNNAGSNTGSISMYTGVGNQGLSGNINIYTGITGLDNTTTTGSVDIYSGIATSGAATGEMSLHSGNLVNGDGSTRSGDVFVYSGDADDGETGEVTLETGAVTGGTQNSGHIRIITGTSVGGNRGRVRVNAQKLSLEGSTLLTLNSQASNPTGIAGDVYYNSTSNVIRYYNGTAWIDLSSGASSSGAAGSIQFSDGSGGFSSDSANIFWDDTNNRLGVGSNTPAHPVHINSAAGGYTLYVQNTSGGSLLGLEGSSGETVLLGAQSGTCVVGTQTNENFYLRANGNNVVSVTPTNRLGIGTSSPTKTLQVVSANNTDPYVADFYHSSVGLDAIISVTNTSSVRGYLIAGDSSAKVYVGSETAHNFVLRSANTDYMEIATDGTVSILSNNLDMNANKIVDLADPTSAQDAATKAYVDAAIAVNEKELFILSAGDITNQYIDLANVALTDSIDFLVRGGGIMVEGASYDYSVSYTGGAGGNTRITFLNDLATAGASALVAGDVVVVKYQHN